MSNIEIEKQISKVENELEKDLKGYERLVDKILQ